jgi:stage V sporulation protein SpoVS
VHALSLSPKQRFDYVPGVMRSKAIIAAIGALLVGGAAKAADITARYVMPSIGNAVMTVQADDRGNSRISVDDESAVITTNGVSYVLMADRQGTLVVRREDMLAVQREVARTLVGAAPIPERAEPRVDFSPPTEAGIETVAGRTGTIWVVLRADGPEADRMDLVVGADPDLAPIGRALARQFRESTFVVGAGVDSLGLAGELPRAALSIVERGTILRYGDMARLQSVDTSPIPASAFTLPAAPLTREQFAARVRRQMLPSQ